MHGAMNMARAKVEIHIVPSAAHLFMESMIAVALCVGTAGCVQAQGAQQSSTDESWTTTKDTTIANANPSRTRESHTKSGNRTIDKQTFEVLGPDGRYQTFSETEVETVRTDPATTRTVVRTYVPDGNGKRKLVRATEEEARTTANGDAHVVRETSAADASAADVNGSLQVVQREVTDTRNVSPDVEETKSTVYQPDSSGGFAQTQQTQELKTRKADDSVEVKKKTLLRDGNGNWGVSEVAEKTIEHDGKNRITEERVSQADSEGRLSESSRTVSTESETTTGEKRKTVETYSNYAPGYADSSLHLNWRVTTIQKKDSRGEVTEEQVEEPNWGNPSDSPRVTARTKYVVEYTLSGTHQTKTVEARDGGGNFSVVSVETQKSDQAPPTQKPTPPADKPH